MHRFCPNPTFTARVLEYQRNLESDLSEDEAKPLVLPALVFAPAPVGLELFELPHGVTPFVWKILLLQDHRISAGTLDTGRLFAVQPRNIVHTLIASPAVFAVKWFYFIAI